MSEDNSKNPPPGVHSMVWRRLNDLELQQQTRDVQAKQFERKLARFESGTQSLAGNEELKAWFDEQLRQVLERLTVLEGAPLAAAGRADEATIQKRVSALLDDAIKQEQAKLEASAKAAEPLRGTDADPYLKPLALTEDRSPEQLAADGDEGQRGIPDQAAPRQQKGKRQL